MESIPDWLQKVGDTELGEKWPAEIHALNEEAEVVLRVNTLKTTRERLKNQLAADGINTYIVKGYPDALVLEERQKRKEKH